MTLIRSVPILLAVLVCAGAACAQDTPAQDTPAQDTPTEGTIRFATFNASLNRGEAGQLIADLSDPAAEQPSRVAAIIQHVDPDVILINEFDYDEGGEAARLFIDNFLAISQEGMEPWVPEAWYSAPVNTGVPTGLDFNRDGVTDGPDDAYGFGFFPGQYGMLVLSKFPIAEDDVRTFQNFLWADMPAPRLPSDPESGGEGDWYSPEMLEVFRLSSKSHWDVPIAIAGHTVHALVSHPTPPAFDGPERRNQLRNADEVQFWIDYISGQSYMTDDAGAAGGLPEGASFVIMGDQNLDPLDGDGVSAVMADLLASDRITDPLPASEGGVEDAERDGGANAGHQGDPRYDTSDFFDGEGGAGNLRVDYALPSRDLEVAGSGVFWPLSTDPLADLLGTEDAPTTDHRLVWVDIVVPQ